MVQRKKNAKKLSFVEIVKESLREKGDERNNTRKKKKEKERKGKEPNESLTPTRKTDKRDGQRNTI
jgi:hypothetical protein